MWFRTLIFDSECQLVGTPTENQAIDESTIIGVLCCTKDFDSDTGYLISCDVDEKKCDTSQLHNVVNKIGRNQPGCWSYISRCVLRDCQLKCDANKKQESMLIKEEKIEGMIEYTKDKMIMSLYPTDLIILNKWKIVSIIIKLQPGNI